MLFSRIITQEQEVNHDNIFLKKTALFGQNQRYIGMPTPANRSGGPDILAESTLALYRDLMAWRLQSNRKLSPRFTRNRLDLPSDALARHTTGTPFAAMRDINAWARTLVLQFSSTTEEEQFGTASWAREDTLRQATDVIACSHTSRQVQLYSNMVEFSLRPLMLGQEAQIGQVEILEGQRVDGVGNNMLFAYAAQRMADAGFTGQWPPATGTPLGAIITCRLFGSARSDPTFFRLLCKLSAGWLIPPDAPEVQAHFPRWQQYLTSDAVREAAGGASSFLRGELNLSWLHAYTLFALEQHLGVIMNHIAMPRADGGLTVHWVSDEQMRNAMDPEADS
jgi:hypothetical protein